MRRESLTWLWDARRADTAAQVPELRRIVGLRNVLIHAYAAVDDDVVWAIATTRLTSLIQLLDALLDSGGSADE